MLQGRYGRGRGTAYGGDPCRSHGRHLAVCGTGLLWCTHTGGQTDDRPSPATGKGRSQMPHLLSEKRTGSSCYRTGRRDRQQELQTYKELIRQGIGDMVQNMSDDEVDTIIRGLGFLRGYIGQLTSPEHGTPGSGLVP